MNRKEQAINIFDKHFEAIFDIDNGIDVSKDSNRVEAARICSLISVDEIINYLRLDGYSPEIDFWEGVKEEILNHLK